MHTAKVQADLSRTGKVRLVMTSHVNLSKRPILGCNHFKECGTAIGDELGQQVSVSLGFQR